MEIYPAKFRTVIAAVALFSFFIGGLLVHCQIMASHSMTGDYGLYTDSAVVAVSNKCCQLQNNSTESVYNLLTHSAQPRPPLRDFAIVLMSIGAALVVTLRLYDQAADGLKFYSLHHPDIKLHSFLNLALAQGLLNPRTYSFFAAGV
ncbi:MAG: hypothetical protein WC621_02155 [Patescibacteria group bacterium]